MDGVGTQLFCAWLAWCRFRVVLALSDKTLPSVMAAIDPALRIFGGVPTYGLSDNEKTVTVEHVAGSRCANPQMLAFCRHYGLTLATCVPADPASKGGSENAVKIAKADLVPCEANLLPEYASFAELEAACAVFCAQVNHRPHRVTRRAPAEMLAEERTRLHPLPGHPYLWVKSPPALRSLRAPTPVALSIPVPRARPSSPMFPTTRCIVSSISPVPSRQAQSDSSSPSSPKSVRADWLSTVESRWRTRAP